MRYYSSRTGITCRECRFCDKALCGYIAKDGTKDRQGNIISINFDLIHNCSDFRRKIKTSEMEES